MVDQISTDRIEGVILTIRGQRVMLDADLATLYGVETKRLNEQVRRNLDRFPDDFMFRLTADEKAKVVANCDHLQRLKFSPALPFAFTEHGAVMLASVLSTPMAVEASVAVVRAFIRLRHLLALESEIHQRLEALEARAGGYEVELAILFEELTEIRRLVATPITRAIGFQLGP